MLNFLKSITIHFFCPYFRKYKLKYSVVNGHDMQLTLKWFRKKVCVWICRDKERKKLMIKYMTQQNWGNQIKNVEDIQYPIQYSLTFP